MNYDNDWRTFILDGAREGCGQDPLGPGGFAQALAEAPADSPLHHLAEEFDAFERRARSVIIVVLGTENADRIFDDADSCWQWDMYATCSGAGVSIWDERWDHLWKASVWSQTVPSKYEYWSILMVGVADDSSSGSLDEALMIAAEEEEDEAEVQHVVD